MKKGAYFYFEPELLKKLKHEAVSKDKSISELLNDILKERYENEQI